jgi:hypothetical protein
VETQTTTVPALLEVQEEAHVWVAEEGDSNPVPGLKPHFGCFKLNIDILHISAQL